MASDNSLIEFPCDFQIKIMGENTPTFQEEITHIASAHYSKEHIIDVRSQPSKQGNYLAITLTVHAQDKPTLDALYHALTKHKQVKMVL